MIDLADWMIRNLLNESQLDVVPPGHSKPLRDLAADPEDEDTGETPDRGEVIMRHALTEIQVEIWSELIKIARRALPPSEADTKADMERDMRHILRAVERIFKHLSDMSDVEADRRDAKAELQERAQDERTHIGTINAIDGKNIEVYSRGDKP